MKKQMYFILLAVILIFCFRGQFAYAEETPLQVEDNWLTREVARQVGKSNIKTLTQEDFHKIIQISIDDYKKEIAEIPKEITFLTNLTELTLSNQRIKELPIELFSLINLKTLDFSLNFDIGKIPKEICQLKNLENLDLCYNDLFTFPQEILDNTKLKKLNLSSCKLETIPIDITKLTQISELQLAYNNIKEFPIILSQLNTLTHLSLGGNKLNEIPPEVGDFKNLSYLSLESNSSYLNIPYEINKLTTLEELDLSYNSECIIPTLKLPNLRILNIAHCYLHELPKGLANLPKFQQINFQYNNISKLPYLPFFYDGINQHITLPIKKVVANSTLEIKNVISASSGAIDIKVNNNGIYNKNNDSISWKINSDTKGELTYTFHLYPCFAGTVYQPISIVKDESELADNKIFFTDDYVGKTVTKNETICIPVKLSTIKDYYALDSSIKYDKTKLEFTGYSIKENYKDCYADSSDVDTLRFILASKGKKYPIKTSDDPIIYLNFKCIATGDADVTITSTTLANLNEEVTVKADNLDKTTIHITGTNKPTDINRDDKFSLIDLAIDAYYYGVDADETDKTKYDADIIPDGKIDDLDLMEITKNIMNNK